MVRIVLRVAGYVAAWTVAFILASMARSWLVGHIGPEFVEDLSTALFAALGGAVIVALFPAMIRGAREIAADKATGDWRQRR